MFAIEKVLAVINDGFAQRVERVQFLRQYRRNRYTSKTTWCCRLIIVFYFNQTKFAPSCKFGVPLPNQTRFLRIRNYFYLHILKNTKHNKVK